MTNLPIEFATGDCDFEEEGEVGVEPGACFGGWIVGIRFVRVYVATWKTEYTVNGRRARGICRDMSHTKLITARISGSWEGSNRDHTKVLNVLITKKHESHLLRLCTRLDSCSVSFEYNDTISCDGRNEG